MRILDKRLESVKSKEYVVLLILILLNIAIRLPIAPHEVGSDSFVYHSMAKSILEDRKTDWTFYLWEFFSQDASSLPVTNSLNVAVLSIYTGVMIEEIIWIFSVFLGVLGVLAAYLMAREIFDELIYRMFTVFVFSLSPIYIFISLQTISTRGLLMSLLPLLIWSFLKFQNTRKRFYIVLGGIFFILFIPIHHTFILTYSIIGAFILTEIYFSVKKRFQFSKSRITKHLQMFLFLLFVFALVPAVFAVNNLFELVSLNVLLALVILLIFYFTLILKENFSQLGNKLTTILSYVNLLLPLFLIFLFISLLFLQLFSGIAFFEKLKWGYKEGFFFKGETIQVILLNMMVDYGSSEGILFPFVLSGFFIALKNVNYQRRYLFIVLILLSCSFILIHGEYMTIFLSIVFSIFIVYGVMGLIKWLRWYRKLTLALTITFLIISILFTGFMTEYWLVKLDRGLNTQWIQERTLNTAKFLNSRNTESKVITTNDALFIRRIKLYISAPMGWIYEIMPYSYQDEKVREIISEKNIGYVIENENIKNQLVGSSQLYPSPFISEMYRLDDKIYDNGLQGVWEI